MSAQKEDCLLEIGCEELPTGSLQPLSTALRDLLQAQLLDAEIGFLRIDSYVTPRRLAIIIYDLESQQAPRSIEQLGPPIAQAYDNQGNPTLACMGFARSCNVSCEQLEIKDTPKGQRVACLVNQPGAKTITLLPQFIKKIIMQLPIAKPMHWGNHAFTFVRPVHWAVLLYGNQPLSMDLLGVATNSQTYGHRFLHPQALTISKAADYVKILEKQAFVIADFAKRRQRILDLIQAELRADEEAVIDADLLDEVTGLVEWPVALRGGFRAEFLQVPSEVLITSMQSHQKCFPVINKQQQLQPFFIVVSNIISKDPSMVIRGNERVINARLSDAAFFYHKDCNIQLMDLAPKLHHVVYQQQLGSLAEKTQRVVGLSESIAKQMGADVLLTGEAAALAKCDLLTEMVGEFPSLQGVMGYYYALNNKLSVTCALAIKQHYWPRFAKDALPTSPEGLAIALADRVDTLIGIFGINQAPTGDKDPFALRRAALGICRLVIEKSLNINILTLLQEAERSYASTVTLLNPNVVEEAYQFIVQRLKSWYLDKQISVDVFNAVAACRPTMLTDFDRRVMAVVEFKRQPEAETLAAANKRVSNILKKQAEEIPNQIAQSLLTEPAEQQLAQLLENLGTTINELSVQKDYTAAFSSLAAFKPAVDEFFDKVMVMTKDPAVRLNRLALLKKLRHLFTQIADIALLQEGTK